MSMLYRQEILSSDLGVILNIVQSSGFFSTAEVEMACELATDRLENGQQSSYQFLFAENDGEVVGYTCYGLIPATAASYDLYWIAVHRDHQGSGVGGRLLARTEKSIRGMGGHAIPETKIRERWTASIANLIALLPDLAEVRVFDNSATVPPGEPVPDPTLVAVIQNGRLAWPAAGNVTQLQYTPDWAKPILVGSL